MSKDTPTRTRGPRGPARDERPAKRFASLPLFPHGNGQWAKKIRGRFVFFGPWRNPIAARDRYLLEKDELHAGMVPRGRPAAAAGDGAAVLARREVAEVLEQIVADNGAQISRLQPSGVTKVDIAGVYNGHAVYVQVSARTDGLYEITSAGLP